MGNGLFWVFFIYGLAFFGMGIAMAMESWRVSSLAEARVLLPLAGFGLVHGAHEWLEAYLILGKEFNASLPDWAAWLRLGMLGFSFFSLAVFAFQSLRLVQSPLPPGLKHGTLFVGAYILFILASAISTYDHQPLEIQTVLDALARYLLAVPASVMAALGLHYIGRYHPNARLLAPWMNGTAIGFGVYAFTQLFVAPIAMFPANVLNHVVFLAVSGVPIQLLRAAMAILITVCLLRATQVTEESLKAELLATQQARLEALEQKESLRRELLRHTIRAQEDERARIARELHDETAQTLTAFSLELAALRRGLSRRSASALTVERLLDLSRQVTQSLYRIMTGLRPAQLDELGLVQAITALVNRDYLPQGFDIRIEAAGTARRLDNVVETALFRVAQESLTNLARHSGVRAGGVRLCFEAGEVILRVSDSGRGYDPDEPFHAPRGWGLEGMRERVEAVGGALRIESEPAGGTTVEARIPLTREVKEKA